MDAYQLAINQAKEELAEAQQKLKMLTLRVSQLESVVTQLEALTAAGSRERERGPLFALDGEILKSNLPRLSFQPHDGGAAQWSSTLTTAVPLPAEPQPPLWKAIINALNGQKSDFTVPQALAALERTGRHIKSPNKLNIIRNTLIHSKAFGRLGSGHYHVVGYEPKPFEEQEKEASPEEKTS
jgi:hypothetical protein